MTADFDPARFGRPVPDSALAALRNGSARPRLPRPGKGELYLGGPIPMEWIERATPLRGRAWHLACALWFDALCARGKTKSAVVQPSRRTLRRFGICAASTYYRALDALEIAGLVHVEKRPGRRPLVTILSARPS